MTGVKFNKCSMGILYPIGMAFSYFMTLISYKLLRKVSYTRSNKELAYYNQKPFEIALVMVLSEATLFILYFIQKAITKRRTLRKSISMGLQAQEIYKTIEVIPGNKKFLVFLKILPICILDLASIVTLSILRESKISFFELDYKVFLIIITTGFSIFILHYKYYSHHLVGFGLVLLGIIVFTAIEYSVNDFTKEKYLVLCLILTIIVQFCTGFQETIEKYLMESLYVNCFGLVGIEGITGTILLAFSFIPLYYIPCPSTDELYCNSRSTTTNTVENLYDSLKFLYRHPQYIALLVLLYFSFMSFNFFRILTNSKFSPSHRGFADVIGYSLFWIFQTFIPLLEQTNMHTFPYLLYSILCFFIIMIGILIYLEIITLQFCGFDKNTRSEIVDRSMSDSTNYLLDENEKNNSNIEINEKTEQI